MVDTARGQVIQISESTIGMELLERSVRRHAKPAKTHLSQSQGGGKHRIDQICE